MAAPSCSPSFANPVFDMPIQHLSPAFASPEDLDTGSRGTGGGVVLDDAALRKLRELDPRGESKLIARVVKAFDGSATRLLAQLNEAHGAGDLNGVRQVAHTLKSSSASVGALRLSSLCAEVETMARQGGMPGFDERIHEMAIEIPKVQVALRTLAENET